MINYKVVAANGDANAELASAMAISRLLNQDFTRVEWRKSYQQAFVELAKVEANVRSVDFFERALQDFQTAVVDGAQLHPADYINFAAREVVTVRISGSAHPEYFNLQSLPIADWVATGVAEPAVAAVADFHEVQLPPNQLLFAMAAGAEYAPVEHWLAAGGALAAVMRPNPAKWQQLIATARNSAGTLLVPVLRTRLADCDSNYLYDDEALAELAGLDIVQDLTEISGWFAELADEFAHTTLGLWGYAPGPKHIILQAAMDALAAAAMQALPPAKLTLNWLGTPTDSFVLPDSAEVIDASVQMQGPNYSWSKRAQRWRAELAHLKGYRTAYLVLPPAFTDSVLRHKWLRVAYAGAPAVGIYPFKLGLARATAFALLGWKLWQPLPSGEVFDVSQLAVSGGLWRRKSNPKRGWKLAVLIGLFRPWWRIKPGQF